MNYSQFGSAGNGSTTNFFSSSGVNTFIHKTKMTDKEPVSLSGNETIELHIYSPDTFDWKKLAKNNVVVVVVNGNIQGNVNATNVTVQNINGDIKESVNVTVSGNLNGNIKNAVNVTRR